MGVPSSESPILFEGEVVILDDHPEMYSASEETHPEVEEFLDLAPDEDLYVSEQGSGAYRVMKMSRRA